MDWRPKARFDSVPIKDIEQERSSLVKRQQT